MYIGRCKPSWIIAVSFLLFSLSVCFSISPAVSTELENIPENDATIMRSSVSGNSKSLVTVTTATMPPLEEDSTISRLLAIDGQAVALGDDFIWVLDENEQQWLSRDGWPQGKIIGVARGEYRTFLLISTADTNSPTQLERIIFVADRFVSSALPPLPVHLTSAQGALLDDQIFVAGIAGDGTAQFFAINISEERLAKEGQPSWEEIEAWSGNSDSVLTAVAQNGVLLVTLLGDVGTGERLLKWMPDQGWAEQTAVPGRIVKGSAHSVGQAHALYLVVTATGNNIKPQIMSFHTITGSWASHGEVDAEAIGFSMGWHNGIFWAQPSVHGIGSSFGITELVSENGNLEWLDWAVIAAYMFGMLGIGLYFYKQDAQKSEADYFLGGRSIPFWAAGISLYVSNASSISYIAIPGKAFATNWQYLLGNLINAFAIMLVAVWIIPLLRRLDLMSIFHYLETRFHPSIRCCPAGFSL